MSVHSSILQKMQASALALGLAFMLAACGGGNAPEPAPRVGLPAVTPTVVVTTLTVAFSSPSADGYVTGTTALQVAVTGTPTTVELYQNAVLLATLPAPYQYNWGNAAEPDGVYAFTAKAIKAGTADVLSAPRTLTLDRTAPTLLSRLPANGAANVQSADEISITMSEAILPSSVNAANVRLLVGGVQVASMATLDSTGRKISVAFNQAPALPATVTLAVSGITDLAQNAAGPITDASFIMPAPVVSPTLTTTLQVTLSSNEWISTTQGDTLGSHKAYIVLQNDMTPLSYDRTGNVDLFFNDSIVKVGMSGLARPSPFACPASSLCGEMSLGQLSSFNNGNVLVKARFRRPDGSFVFSATTPLKINIPNLDAGQASGGWRADPTNIGTLENIAVPSALTPVQQPGAQVFGYDTTYSGYFRHTGAPGVNPVSAVFTKRYPITTPYTPASEHKPRFTVSVGNTMPNNNDYVVSRIRGCSALNACTVWNRLSDSRIDAGGFASPPYIPDIAFIELELFFNVTGVQSTTYVGNIFVGY